MTQTAEGYQITPNQIWYWEQANLGVSHRHQFLVSVPTSWSTEKVASCFAKSCDGHAILHAELFVPDDLNQPLLRMADRVAIRTFHHTEPLPESWWQASQAIGQAIELHFWPQLFEKFWLQVVLPAQLADRQSGHMLLRQTFCHLGDPLPEDEGVQYMNYVEWYHELKQEDVFADGQSFWKDQRPYAQNNEPIATTSFDLERITSPFPTAWENQPCCPESDAFFQACLAIYVARKTQNPRIPIGVAADGRSFEELNPVVGPFAKHLPLIQDYESTTTFSQWLTQWQEALEASANWQDFFSPSSSKKGLSHLVSRWQTPYLTADIELTDYRQDVGSVDLHLQVDVEGKRFIWDYNTASYSERDMAFFTAGFSSLAEHAFTHPQTLLGDLPLLGNAEKQALEAMFAPLTRSTKAPVHLRFLEHAEKFPNNIAIESDKESLTFEQAAQRSLIIANYLSNHLPEDGVVALCLNRDSALVLSMLAAMCAQRTYLILDPSWPVERHRKLVEDAEARLLLTDPSRFAACSEWHDHVVGVDRVPHSPGLDVETTRNQIDSQAPVYRIYTSGSTGTPKAIHIGHRQISHYTDSLIQQLQLNSDMRFGLISSLAADLGYTCFFPPLALGATLVLLPEKASRDATHYQQYLQDHSIDVLKITPSHLKVLLPEQDLGDALPKRMLLLGGEAADPSWIQTLQQAQPALRLINHYGPTETTVGVITGDYQGGDIFPLGKPLPGTRAYVLDSRLQRCPIGSVGELCISGPSLAEGYASEPAGAQEKFTVNPHDGAPFDALYRTGDLAKVDSDGRLHFLGRRDFQVKIRGYRVELGEIEAALNQVSDIHQAVVLATVPKTKAAQHLVAFFTAAKAMSGDDLHQQLSETLPDYMVPSHWIPIPELPLMANGKVDRQHLLSLAQENLFLDRSMAPAESALEKSLVLLWCDVLKMTPVEVGVTTPFFQLGGHSLLLIMLSTRIQKIFNLHLGIDKLFQASTIRQMAALICDHVPTAEDHAHRLLDTLDAHSKTHSGEENESYLPDHILAAFADTSLETSREFDNSAIAPRLEPSWAPQSYEQQRLWFLYCFEGKSSSYNNPAAFRIHGAIDADALGQSFAMLEARHEILRSRFQNRDGQAIQVIHAPRERPLSLEDLSDISSESQAEKLTALLNEEVATPFDLENEMPWRARLIRLAPDSHLLLYTIHHICSDGWSMRLFVKELFACYRHLTQGQPLGLKPLHLQYGDFASWQKDYFQGDVKAHSEAFWKSYLGDAPLQPYLPYDHPSPDPDENIGANHTVHISSKLAQDLRELATSKGTTLFAVLLTGYGLAMRFLSKRDDLVIGTDVANRQQKETEDLIGFFVNQLAIRLKFQAGESLDSLLAHTQNNLVSLLNHQSFPFSEVVNTLGISRDQAHSPIFQTKFFLEHKQAAQELPTGMTLERLQPEKFSARLDLTLGLWNHADGPVQGWFNYNASKFHASTIQRLADIFETILQRLCSQPETSVDELMLALIQSPTTTARRTPTRRERPARKTRKRRSKITVATGELVIQEALHPTKTCPLRIRPTQPGVSLASWIRANRDCLDQRLSEAGAIVFEDFSISDMAQFEEVAQGLIDDVFKENSEHQPVSDNGAVQIPVAYAADQHLLWHNENTFNYQWPTKILFGCHTAAAKGGETPFVDSRLVFEHLPDRIRRPFLEKGIQYMRTYSEALGLSWQQVFKTDAKQDVEAMCRESHFDFRWLADGRLQTRATRPAAIAHGKTGAMCWINQALHWHFSCLAPETQLAIAKLFEPDHYPRHCFFGDGSPIPDDFIAEIHACYQKLEVVIPWKAGQLLLLDNALVAHARRPFEGERRIFVSMGDLTDFSQFPLNLLQKGHAS